MAPTTLVGQKTTTSPRGRDAALAGHPIRMAELLAALESPAYIARVSVHNPANINRAKRAIQKAFEVQVNDQGFGFVEVLSSCPTNWGLAPIEALKWVEEHMVPYYPLGEFKTVEGAD